MIKKFSLYASLILFVIALVSITFPAFFARFMADDYCMNAGAQSANFSTFFKSVYTGWSGRFAYIASTYFLSRIPAQTFGYLVFGVVVAWVLVLSGAFTEVSKLLNINLRWTGNLILAILLLIALFKTAPNIYQNLFWRDGLVNYLVPLIFTSLSLMLTANVIQKGLSVPKALLLASSALLSAGFSESSSIANLVFWLALCLLVASFGYPRKKVVLLSLGISTFSALIGFLIEFLAPGNQVRADILPDRPGLLELAGLTLRNVAHLYGRLLVYGFIWVLVCLLVGLLLGNTFGTGFGQASTPRSKKSMRNWFIEAALANLLPTLGVCAAVAYLMRAFPDDRILIIPNFFALLTVLMTGLALGNWLKSAKSTQGTNDKKSILRRYSPCLLLILAAGLALIQVTRLIKALPALTNYAQRWDARDALIRSELAAGKNDLVIPGLEARFGLPDLQLEKDDWVNTCTAEYYGVTSITGK